MNMGDAFLSINLESLNRYVKFHLNTFCESTGIFPLFAEKFHLDYKNSEATAITESGEKYRFRFKYGDMAKMGKIKTKNEVVIERNESEEKLKYSSETILFFATLNDKSAKLYFFNSVVDRNGKLYVECNQFVCAILSNKNDSGGNQKQNESSYINFDTTQYEKKFNRMERNMKINNEEIHNYLLFHLKRFFDKQNLIVTEPDSTRYDAKKSRILIKSGNENYIVSVNNKRTLDSKFPSFGFRHKGDAYTGSTTVFVCASPDDPYKRIILVNFSIKNNGNINLKLNHIN
jgi:hypothetical protein